MPASGASHDETLNRKREIVDRPTIEANGFDILFLMRLAADCINGGQFPDVYRPVCADCIAAIRSSI